MNEIDKIKEKISKFLEKFKSEQIKSPDDTIKRFKELFKNEYFEIYTHEEEPYYESHNRSIYIVDGYGIGIENVWGPGDFTGGRLVSNEREEVCIFSKLANTYIKLFESSERNNNLENISELYNIDLSQKNLEEVEDDNVFLTIPNNLKNEDELVKGRYNNLKRIAEMRHKNDIENDMISYYGGLDIIIHSTEYYLYQSLLKQIDDVEFMKKTIPMFNKDYPKYIDQQIDECEHALYIINNSDEYYKISDLSEDIQKVEDKIYNIEISMSDILQERTGLSIKSKDIENKITELENKKYTILSC